MASLKCEKLSHPCNKMNLFSCTLSTQFQMTFQWLSIDADRSGETLHLWDDMYLWIPSNLQDWEQNLWNPPDEWESHISMPNSELPRCQPLTLWGVWVFTQSTHRASPHLTSIPLHGLIFPSLPGSIQTNSLYS
jgi:hypothetical protein